MFCLSSSGVEYWIENPSVSGSNPLLDIVFISFMLFLIVFLFLIGFIGVFFRGRIMYKIIL